MQDQNSSGVDGMEGVELASGELLMIPTRSRTRIPQGWSYPIGAQVVSHALEGVTQYESLALRFLWQNPASRLAGGDRSRLFLLGVHHTNPEQTALDRNWLIDIMAVPGEQKALVSDLLVQQVLPQVHSWMVKSRTPAWHARENHLYVSFNLDTQHLESGST